MDTDYMDTNDIIKEHNLNADLLECCGVKTVDEMVGKLCHAGRMLDEIAADAGIAYSKRCAYFGLDDKLTIAGISPNALVNVRLNRDFSPEHYALHIDSYAPSEFTEAEHYRCGGHASASLKAEAKTQRYEIDIDGETHHTKTQFLSWKDTYKTLQEFHAHIVGIEKLLGR